VDFLTFPQSFAARCVTQDSVTIFEHERDLVSVSDEQ
jgi:hypothetical protein